MSISFTPDQEKVIYIRKRNVLVAAAAGSGKTAVLVERIAEMVSDEEHPLDIDKLLVVTFTNAAAAEMRERIVDALTQRLENQPDHEHLQKQVTLIHNAQITTIDSFCLFVIRNNFNEIGLDPGFRIGDEGECKLLKQDVLEELLEQQFEEGSKEFLHCVETYSTSGSERFLEETILNLYEFSKSHPWPRRWLEQCKLEYAPKDAVSMEDTLWGSYLNKYVHDLLSYCGEMLEMGLRICESSDGPYMYASLLESEIEDFTRLQACESLFLLYEGIKSQAFGRLPSKKDESVSPEKRESVKGMRNSVKEIVTGLKKKYFFKAPTDCLEDLIQSKPALDTLIDLVIAFGHLFAQKKQSKNMIDFGDMEHFALDILLTEEDGQAVPTPAARAYQEYFHEILIDEYQDSNLVQEYLLSSISKKDLGGYNQFMVGDVKQSIYKFRLARPELFMEKYNNYTLEDSNQVKIDLHQNFRSRIEVLDSVNDIFEQLMTKEAGGVEYDLAARLFPGASYETVEGQDQRTELLLLEKGDNTSKKELEASLVAARIKELVGHFLITDKQTGKLRTAQYKDIVILLRSNSGWDEEFKKVFEAEGIPVHITSKRGYFSAVEVEMVLNFLRILDNPLQDIPLCGVLRSYSFDFSHEELALIKSSGSYENLGGKPSNKKFYELLLHYAQEGQDRTLQSKINDFLKCYRSFRQKVPYMQIHELIQDFMTQSDLSYYIGTLPGGEQRYANIAMLIEKAIAFESTSYKGLFHFIRYIEQMEKYDVDFGEANTLDENADTVRIMSIHKSKGLEFPICILAGLSKQFNKQDLRRAFVWDMDYGIGTDYVNWAERTKCPTIRKNAMAAKMEVDNIGEELRILYVALTRAKEKLIMTGVVDDMPKTLEKYEIIKMYSHKALPFGEIVRVNSYLDCILMALARKQEELLGGEGKNLIWKLLTWQDITQSAIQQTLSTESLRLRLLQGVDERGTPLRNTPLEGIMKERFSFIYPYSILSKLYTKTTVSELKKQMWEQSLKEEEEGVLLYEEPAIVPYIPAFIQEKEEISGTGRGSAYHKVLELLPFAAAQNRMTGKDKEESIQMIQEMLSTLTAEGKLSKIYEEAVNPTALLAFLQSLLGRRMTEAEEKGLLKKEQPFVLGVPANEIQGEFPEEETILVQGIIDVYFEEENELVVMDYKTDRVKTEEELVEKYKPQLDYYAKALEQLTHKKVKEKIIYSFTLGREILLR